MNRTDSEIEGYVKEELQWSPDLDSADVAVSVKQGVVALTGFVHSYLSYLNKYEAEAAAKRVAGVTAVANDIEVRLPSVDQRSDPEIARDAVASIKTQLPVSWEHIKIVVKDGWMTLEGEVEWQYQRATAEHAVRGVKGIRGVSNWRQQFDPAETARSAVRAQEKDSGGVPPRRRGRCQSHYRRSGWWRGHPQGDRAVVGRTAGGRARGVVCAGRYQSGRSYHCEPIARLSLQAKCASRMRDLL